MKQNAVKTAAFVMERTGCMPETGILTGTGLGGCLESIVIAETFSYMDIPNFPVSTVESHEGKLVLGKIEEKDVIAMSGRFHLYEGYSSFEPPQWINILDI